MNNHDYFKADEASSFTEVDLDQLPAVEGGFGGGFEFGWGGWTQSGSNDGTSWDIDIHGTCGVDGTYY